MERITPEKQELHVLRNKIQALSVLVTRAQYAASLGTQTYGGDRDVYQALGYPTDITYTDYISRYNRQDIAKAIIDRPVKAAWEGELNVIENKDDKETALEAAWSKLNDSLKLKSIFSRTDKLAGIGSYALMVLGLSDVSVAEQDMVKPVTGTKLKLLYVKPVSEYNSEITKWDKDPKSPRFGLPLIYGIKITEAGGGSDKTVQVHYSRVIHVIDDILESDVVGTPRLQGVFNRLIDLEKLVGGSAEMFWRGARPGYQGKVDKDYSMSDATKKALQDQLNEMEHNLRRYLINEGVSLEPLAQQVADPKNHVDIQIQMISAVTGIPKRILTGSERGELSSSQDKNEWNSFINNRRQEFLEPRLIRPFVDVLIRYGILPKPKTEKYDILWSDLFAKSELEMVEVGNKRATAIKEYTMNPLAESVMPLQAFFEFCLGLNQDQIDLIMEMQKAQTIDEPDVTPEESQIMEEETE